MAWKRPKGIILPESIVRPRDRYDKERADRVIDFLQLLPHVKGRQWAGERIELRPWQEEPLRDIFGTLNPDGTRQYRIVYWEIPKKNGKTTVISGVGLYLFVFDGELGAEIYSAAYDKTQASISFDIAAGMVRRTPALAKRVKIRDSMKQMDVLATNSFWRAVEGLPKGQHGYNVHGLLFDEFHVQKTAELFNTLHEGTALRAQPLTFIITTAGVDRESPCYKFHAYARKILNGQIEPDPSFYPVIWSPVTDDRDFDKVEWQKEKVWHACNPALGDFLPVEQMRASARRAAEIPSEQNEFKRLRIDIWTQQVKRWITVEKWDACEAAEIRKARAGGMSGHEIQERWEGELAGRSCYGGLDLGAVSDLTGWALIFPATDDPEFIDILIRAFCPKARLFSDENIYRDSYQAWEREGWLITTEGEATDYAFVKKQILDDLARFRMVDMAVDRKFQAHHLSNELLDEGVDVVGISTGFEGTSAATRELEERIIKRKVRHNGNPLLRFCVDNAAVKSDPDGNIRLYKKASEGKIDPLQATVFALDRGMRHEGYIPQPPRALPRLLRKA